MPAGLATIRGQTAMMYCEEVPWHGLGQKLDRPATAAEAIKAAQLDWEVEKRPLYLLQGKAYREIPDRFAVVLKDRIAADEPPVVLGFVGADCTLLQNSAAFDWFDPIAQGIKAIDHTAGALGDGERVWILAKLPDTIRVIGDDIAEKYPLLSNSHDGRSARASSVVEIKKWPLDNCSNGLHAKPGT